MRSTEYHFSDGTAMRLSPRYHCYVQAFLDFMHLNGDRVLLDDRTFWVIETQHRVPRWAVWPIIDAMARGELLTCTQKRENLWIITLAGEVARGR